MGAHLSSYLTSFLLNLTHNNPTKNNNRKIRNDHSLSENGEITC
jgi:hypothetical protein